MDRDLLSWISETAARISRSRAVAGDALARGLAVRDGTDESGTVTIVMDDEGIARDVRLAVDWRSRVDPGRIGEAVVQADAEAARRRATATATAFADASQPGHGPPQAASTGDGAHPPGWLAPVPAVGQRRSLAELSAAVLAAFDDLDRMTQPPPAVHGSGAQGAVQVTMRHGRITACVVNQAWLARQDEMTLAHALREAVSAAATARLTAMGPLVDYQRRLHEIVADARATLAGTRPGGTR